MKYKAIIDKMTLEEKTSMLSGQNFWNTTSVERLGIPSLMITDGPHGLRKQGGKADHLGLNQSLPATCFPTAATLANSWDTALLEQVGELLGEEAAAEDVSVICGPGLNIKRNPLCGRNFEYFSEDPYLTGKMAAAMIRGIQSRGVAACPKHFAVNSQETRRMVINEVVDERALREIYLEGFRRAVQEGGAKSIMTSYNRVNGEFANENMHLMRDILYGEWGFQGVAVTDWGGENDRVKGLIAGNQLEMPSSAGQTDREVQRAVLTGAIDESLVDESVDRLLKLIYDTRDAVGKGKNYTDEEHHQAARRAARESVVLMKNEKNILPLSAGQRIAVIGDFAKTPRYQGAGSSLIRPTKVESAWEALAREDLDIIGYQPGFKRFGGRSESRKRRAVQLSKQAEVVLLFLGLDETSEAECIDRPGMGLKENQLALLDAVRKSAKSLVVVLSGGAPIEMSWSGQPDAIIHGYLGGQASGGAIADVLTGRCNPSGKLTETYPLKYADSPSAGYFPGTQESAEHRESIYVGYRYFDTADVEVAYPFGYGLSYTSFSYRELTVNEDIVRFRIKNTGAAAGSEVAQVYVSKKESRIYRAAKELKGFVKIHLEPGEERWAEVKLDNRAFRFFDPSENRWKEEAGEYQILLGASSQDIRLSAAVNKESGEEVSPSYFAADIKNVTNREFKAVLGHSIPPRHWDGKKPLGYNDTIGQGQYKKGFARFLYNIVRGARRVCLLAGKHIAANNVMFAMHLPYRQLARMSGGRIDMAMLDGILVMVNGSFWRGLRMTLKARREKLNKTEITKV